MTPQPEGIKEGIYFHLSNEDYHNDPALSHSGMTKVLISWPDYWVGSCLNQQRHAWKQTPAMAFGDRSGMLLLQPDVFYKKYNTYGKGSGKANIKGQYLSSYDWAELKESVDAIRNVEIGDAYLRQGYPEVSIFWRDAGTGIMLRARIDYLRTFGCIDLKRIKAVNKRTIGNAVRDQGLDIQNFLYLEAVKAARIMLMSMGDAGRQSLAKRDGVDVLWLEDFMNDKDLLFNFLFQRSTYPYIWKFQDLEPDLLTEGANAVFAAIRKYKAGLEKHGLELPLMGDNTVTTISAWDVPKREYDFD